MNHTRLTLSILPQSFSVCQLDSHAELPSWPEPPAFFSVTRSDDEISVVCEEKDAPQGSIIEDGWRAFKVEGPLDFSLIGILAKITGCLADKEISVFALSTFNTDYILVKEERLKDAVEALDVCCTVRF